MTSLRAQHASYATTPRVTCTSRKGRTYKSALVKARR